MQNSIGLVFDIEQLKVMKTMASFAGKYINL